MKITLLESQIEKLNEFFDIELNEEYPTSWDVDYFSKLKTFKERISYCKKHLTYLASGSSRVAFKIDDQKVLKLALNKKGLHQNETEIDSSNDSFIGYLFGEIFNYDENGLWLEMELAKKMTEKKFEELTNLSFSEYITFIYYCDSVANGYKRKNRYQKFDEEKFIKMIENDHFFSSINDYIGNYDVFIGDLTKPNTYGIVLRDGVETIVIIDYGLTSNSFEKLYRR